MPDPKRDRPTERTKKGYEVPVPKRGEFFANLKKLAGKKPSGPGSSKK